MLLSTCIITFCNIKFLHVIHRIKYDLQILLNGILIVQYSIIIILFLATAASKLMLVYLSLHVHHSTLHSHHCILASQEYVPVNLGRINITGRSRNLTGTLSIAGYQFTKQPTNQPTSGEHVS